MCLEIKVKDKEISFHYNKWQNINKSAMLQNGNIFLRIFTVLKMAWSPKFVWMEICQNSCIASSVQNHALYVVWIKYAGCSYVWEQNEWAKWFVVCFEFFCSVSLFWPKEHQILDTVPKTNLKLKILLKQHVL